MEPNTWNSEAYPISIFGFMKFLEIDVKNMYTSLLCMVNYIRSRKVKSGSINDVSQLKGFGEAAWNFISSIYKSSWDTIETNNNNYSFRNKVANKFTPKVPKTKTSSNSSSYKDKVVKIIKLSLSIPAHSSKKILKKSKFFGKGKEPTTINKVS